MSRSPRQRKVGGRFRITEWAGSGGFANVWRAVDESGGPNVAVKFPRFDGSNGDSIVRERFDRAYETLSSFESGIHPTSLVHFVDGQHRAPKYLVTEFISGEELASTVAKYNVTPGLDLLEKYGLPIARAVGFLHQNNWIYLDVKPENVLIRETYDRPVLVDFNTAEPVQEGDTLFHEDEYKAPEQLPGTARDRPSGPRTDVYGLGKLFAYLLTGSTWETSKTPRDGVDVRQHNPQIPAKVANVVAQATKADPNDRPMTARHLVTRLYHVLDRNGAIALVTDDRNNVECPVRVGDTIGRVADAERLPTVAISDPKRYISPVHLEVSRNNGWLVEDRSLNGTYLKTSDGWQWLLSQDGYRQLQAERGSSVPDEQPYTAARIERERRLAPVDHSYDITLQFDPR